MSVRADVSQLHVKRATHRGYTQRVARRTHSLCPAALRDQVFEVGLHPRQLARSVPADWLARLIDKEDRIKVPLDIAGIKCLQKAPDGFCSLAIRCHLGHEVYVGASVKRQKSRDESWNLIGRELLLAKLVARVEDYGEGRAMFIVPALQLSVHRLCVASFRGHIQEQAGLASERCKFQRLAVETGSTE